MKKKYYVVKNKAYDDFLSNTFYIVFCITLRNSSNYCQVTKIKNVVNRRLLNVLQNRLKPFCFTCKK